MTMVNDKKSHMEYWDNYEPTPLGQLTYFGSHSTLTESVEHMPNGTLLGLRNGSICITSDGVSFIWDRLLGEWIEQ